MPVDAAQRALFGKFPRSVGTPHQFHVLSEGEFDVYINAVNGAKNCYAAISRTQFNGTIALDKVSIDLDTPQKDDGWPALPDLGEDEDPEEDKLIAQMRSDDALADEVLADVLDEAKQLIEKADREGVPCLAVFTGLGMHIHLLYQETTENVRQKCATTARKFIGDLNLLTADPAPIGDHKRLMRVPNAQRIYTPDEQDFMADTRPCGLYAIPILPREFDGLEPRHLLDAARSPRSVEIPDYDRPEMQVHDHYIQTFDGETEGEPRRQQDLDAPVVPDDESGKFLKFILKKYLRMPCMYEGIIQPEPDHRIRQNCAVMLLNLGMSKQEICDLFSRIGWVDWKRKKTMNQLNQIQRNGYADRSCASIMKDGLCTRIENPEDCPTYRWSGGRAMWKNR